MRYTVREQQKVNYFKFYITYTHLYSITTYIYIYTRVLTCSSNSKYNYNFINKYLSFENDCLHRHLFERKNTKHKCK